MTKTEGGPVCPFCDVAAQPSERTTQVRRGDRVLSVVVKHWECTTGCLDEDGASPFRFEDPPTMKANDETIRAAWLTRFGAPLPRAGRPGRKPEEPRDVRVQLMLTSSELAAIDKERGALSRSEFIRQRILKSA